MRVIADLILARSNKWHPSNFFVPSLEIIQPQSFANRPKVCVESSPSTISQKLNFWSSSFMVMGPDARAKPNGHWESAFLGFLLTYAQVMVSLHCSLTIHLKRVVVNTYYLCAMSTFWWYSGGSGDCFPFILFCDKKERYGGSRSLLWPSGVPWQLAVHIVIKGGYMAIRSPPVGTGSKEWVSGWLNVSWGEWMSVFCTVIRLSTQHGRSTS